jgi:aspartyl-tRNA(Asn)/glutamyl-tRNA(Gln) amidotransferase subunit A
MDVRDYSLHRLAEGLAAKEWTSLDLTEACLKVAEANAASTHAYLGIDAEGARAAARASDERRTAGAVLGPLDGIPVALKDNLNAKGWPVSAGSNVLEGYTSPYDATAVDRLRRAGAVLMGRTTMDEFAMGSTSQTCAGGAAKNPWDTSKIPGGSSGGSAVAVAEGSAVVALGSDTGGSVRQPAAMCGITGLKPTYGRVSRYGLIAMASSLDQVGQFGRTAEDVALLLSAVEGQDTMDATSVGLRPEWKLPERLPAHGLKGLRIGLPKEWFGPGMEPEVEAAVRAAVAQMEAQGAVVREVSLPHAPYALAVYYVLMPCEVSANLSRFDGIRYGARKVGGSLEETYARTRGAGFGPEVRRRIMLGTYALSAGYYDAYYVRSLKVRRRIADDFARAFEEVDVIASPTSPSVAWSLGDKADDPVAMYLSDVYTVTANVAGLPAISVPCGFGKGGLPVGLQLTGKHFDEKTLLAAAADYQSVTGWHTRKPGAA